MKKFLSVAVALGMVAGVAATASALELGVKGKYQADGYWIDGATSNGISVTDGAYDADWYQHTFRINADLKVNDKITVKSDIRFMSSNTVWGGGSAGDGSFADGNQWELHKLWMVYSSPIGKFEIGRRPGGAWGHDFVSSSTWADRLFWHLPTGDGPLKAYVFTQKLEENDKDPGLESDGPLVSGFNGGDADYYEVGVGHKAEGMTIYGGLGTSQKDSVDRSLYRAKVFGTIGVGVGNIMFEGDYKFGEASSTVDYDSYAAFVAFAGSAGNISYMAGYATISGDDNAADDELNAYDPSHGTGDDFEPLYIMTGNRTNVLNGDAGANPVGTAVRTAGVHALVATADFKASEDLTLHGGIGYGMADAEPAGWDDDYGWEVNAGLAYQLYQNLKYELHFGYWMVGDFTKMGGMNKEDDVMLLSNHLTLSF